MNQNMVASITLALLAYAVADRLLPSAGMVWVVFSSVFLAPATALALVVWLRRTSHG